MSKSDATLVASLIFDMYQNNINLIDVFEMTDYLELKLNSDMGKVQFYMNVLTGIHPDMRLSK
jgi:hypothetical protein